MEAAEITDLQHRRTSRRVAALNRIAANSHAGICPRCKQKQPPSLQGCATRPEPFAPPPHGHLPHWYAITADGTTIAYDGSSTAIMWPDGRPGLGSLAGLTVNVVRPPHEE